MKLAGLIACVLALTPTAKALPLVGVGNDTCATATPLPAGTYSGLQLSDTWYWEMFTHAVLWYTDVDYYRITVPPGHEMRAAAQITQITGQTYGLWLTFAEAGVTSCMGDMPSGGASVVNVTSVPKDYIVYALAWSSLENPATDLHLTYTLTVSITPALVGPEYCLGAINSRGLSGEMSILGSTSLTANELRFVAHNLPFNSPALLIDGSAMGSTPFGDGTLCVSGAIHRLKVAVAGSNGAWIVAANSFTPTSPWLAPNTTAYFQLWYRDVGGPLGSGFNLTNGIPVTLAP